jgi:hypothetical protein
MEARNKARLLTASIGIFALAGVVLYFAPIGATQPGEGEGAGSEEGTPPPQQGAEGATPERMGNCSGCVSNYCPQRGIRCNWTGDCCQGKAHNLCEYTCQCAPFCQNVSNPSNACQPTLPNNCCPGPCVVEFCKFQDHKCTLRDCQGNCCRYECQDAPCSGPFECPPDACPGTCF